MRLNRIDICSSIDFELISTGFTAPFAFFSLGIPLKAVFSCIIHRVYYQISIAKLDLGRATATVSLHVDLHNQCLYHYPPSPSLFLDQTEYKNNLEIEKIQLNKSVANYGKTNGKFTQIYSVQREMKQSQPVLLTYTKFNGF